MDRHFSWTVISTEADHAFVSSAAEKSASLPQLLIRHALAVVPALKVFDDAEKLMPGRSD
jgi:hypothetical protein